MEEINEAYIANLTEQIIKLRSERNSADDGYKTVLDMQINSLCIERARAREMLK